MPTETVLSMPTGPTATHPVIRRLAETAPAAEVAVVGGHAHPEGSVAGLRRSLRERFQAMTGAGLAPRLPEGRPPTRHRLAPPDGAAPISYLVAGDPSGRRVVFVHGTPGDAADWSAFLHAAPEEQRRLAIDRPGFGGSARGAPVVSLSGQARAVAGLLEYVGGPAVVVGSSYGGPVALRLAADRPDLVDGVLLVGGAADPRHERIHLLQRLAAIPRIADIVPRSLAHSNAELLALRGELEALAADLERIRASVGIVHGLSDTLVPVENAAYLAERLKGARRMHITLVASTGHFLHLLRHSDVEHALAGLLESTPSG